MHCSKFLNSILFGLIGLSVALISVPATAAVHKQVGPPVAPVKPVTDTLYGVNVADPYRYMENLKNPAVEKWFKDENAYTRSVLDKIPGRKQLLADIEKYDNSQPAQVSDVSIVPPDLYFYEKLLPDQQVSKLYMRKGLAGKERLLLDPARYEKKGGPPWKIGYYAVSPNGRHVAVGVSPGGRLIATMHVLDTRTGKDAGEPITRMPGNTVSWLPDGRAFFYTRLRKLPPGAKPMEVFAKSRVWQHVVGTDPTTDRAVFGYGVSPKVAVSPFVLPVAMVPAKSSYALGILVNPGAHQPGTLYVASLDAVGKPDTPWKKVVDNADAVTDFAVHGDALYLLSHKDAPRGKILRIDLAHPDMAHAKTVAPQRKRALIQALVASKDGLYVRQAKGVVSHLLRVPYAGGKPVDIALPYAGTLGGLQANPHTGGVMFTLTSWARAPQLFAYDPATGKVADTHLQPVGPYDNASGLVAEEVMAKSADGTLVPLSIVYRKGLKRDGSNPVLLSGYGSLAVTLYPAYRPIFRAWYDHGGILAVAHVRGGGVYGESWHKAGMQATKANSWHDFIACARYLIAHKYTSAAHLAITGTSAGGILVGRAMTEQPQLFAAVIDKVGLSNSLRMEQMSMGPLGVPEFGSVKTQAGFKSLYAMDSYLHVRNGVKYPAVLLTTGWNDQNVAPWQAGKMTARLQAATASGKPVLLWVDYHGGHGYGATRKQSEVGSANSMSFALWQLGVPGFQPHR
ncbi:MAG: prolyl oligopeptidase family serine peptidase [Gammaproteobacteria bacterium]